MDDEKPKDVKDGEKSIEEKRLEMLERGGPIITEKQKDFDESNIKKVLKIEAFGEFKKGGKKPDPVEISEIGLKEEIVEVQLDQALEEAQRMQQDGVPDNTIVSMRVPEEHGRLSREKRTTLGELLEPETKKMLRKEFESGGFLIFGGGGGSGGPEGSGFRAEHAASTLFKLAGKISEDAFEHPKKRRSYAKAVADIVDSVKSFMTTGLEEEGGGAQTTAGLFGGSYSRREALKPFKGPMWYNMGESSKLAALWWMDNVKFRGQYSYAGEYLGHQWAPIKAWKKIEDARRNKKKYTKLEKLLDIFFINIEDVFEIDKLSAQEIFDLEDYDREHPTEKQYRAMIKLMKEEGYVEERQFISSVKIAKSFQPSDVYYGR